jgi:hypothetical protein
MYIKFVLYFIMNIFLLHYKNRIVNAVQRDKTLITVGSVRNIEIHSVG